MRKLILAGLVLLGFTVEALACHTQSCRRTLSGEVVCSCGPHSP